MTSDSQLSIIIMLYSSALMPKGFCLSVYVAVEHATCDCIVFLSIDILLACIALFIYIANGKKLTMCFIDRS